MIVNSSSIEPIQEVSQLQSKTLIRRFGQENDNIELNIIDLDGNILLNDEQFTDFQPAGTLDSNGLYNSVNIDFNNVLRDYGYNSGVYKMNFSFQRKLILNTLNKYFYISEISPSRQEIKAQSITLSDTEIQTGIENLIASLNQSYIKDINLNFGNANYSLVINVALDTFESPTTVLFKLYEPLSPSVGVNTPFRIIEEIINPIELTVDLGEPIPVEDPTEMLRGPNLQVDFRLNSSVPSQFRTYDEILQNGAVTSSFNNLQNYLSQSVPVDLDFDSTTTTSGYTFENFIHFSSATERLKNFNYKLGLLETYDTDIIALNTITGSTSESVAVVGEKASLEGKKDQVIQGFDYYERYLYFESGTYSWPKSNSSRPYINYSTTSSQALTWLGSEDYTNAYYGGQLLSASLYDDYNVHILRDTLPEHILNNSDNALYVTFVDMVGQHFDGIWAYMDSITDIPQSDSKLTDGISKELVSYALDQIGMSAFDQFENANLFEYLIADDGQGTFQYQAPISESMVSASNDGSIPKGDITKEIWKRLYHNAPYLLKTKGTERGLKALISAYGIPETILHVKEYGGPVVDKTSFRTFSYQKYSKMVNRIGRAGTGNFDSLIRIIGAFQTGSNRIKNSQHTPNSLQVRYLPDPDHKTQLQPIFTIADQSEPELPDLGILISQSIDNSLINSESFAHLILVTGSSTENDITQNKVIASELVPFFNGDVWNISLTLDSGSSNNIKAYATNTTFNKNTYIATCSLNAPEFFADPDFNSSQLWLQPGDNGLDFGANGLSDNTVTGSFQEFRFYDELLTEETIVTQSLSPFNYNGNTISSSYENLVVRIPLGSDLDTPGDSLGVILTLSSSNKAPNPNLVNSSYTDNFLTLRPGKYVSLEETHHLTTPDTVGSAMVSDKVRIDSGSVDDNILSPFISAETSPQDRQPNDYSDLGIFFSPTFEINEDIIYTLGAFRLDDYIGDPQDYTSGSYPELATIKDQYFKKVERRYNFWDYIKLIQYFDHTLWRIMEQFIPAKVNAKTGLVIEPHYLERTKFAGTPITTEEQTIHEVNYSGTGSLSSEYVAMLEANYDVHEILSGSFGTVNENNAQTSRRSSLYFSFVAPYDNPTAGATQPGTVQEFPTDFSVEVNPDDGDNTPPTAPQR